MNKLRYVLLTDKATAPIKASQFAAGFDLFSAYDYILPANKVTLCKIDIAVAIPRGYYARLADRSSLATKSITTIGGVIDADYRGNIIVMLHNFGDTDHHVRTGDRICQMIIEKIYTGAAEGVISLNDTERGTGGFGSTGF